MSANISNTSVGNKPAGVFKTYPEFTKLTLAHRKKYESIAATFPPIEALAFVSLMTWWNSLDSCAVAELNGNLVISYWLPGMDRFSGLAIVGTNDLDASICTILDRLKETGEPARLVHVPEFVINNIAHPELFSFSPMRAFDEYITTVDSQYPLRNLSDFRRKRVRTFMRHTQNDEVVCKSLDLSNETNQQLLIDAIDEWPKEGKGNNYSKFSDDCTRWLIRNADLIGAENFCVFVNGELQSAFMYHYPADKRYVIITHVRSNSEIAYTFDYACYAFCEAMADKGISFVNMTYDLDLQRLRVIKLAFNPTNFFRKYIIEPASSAAPTELSD